MNFFSLLFQLALNHGATFQTVAENTTQAAAPQSNPLSSIALLIAMFAIFYFLLIRPNQKREKQRKLEIANIQEGDKIITSGGIKGTIVSVKDDAVVIDSKGSKIEIVRFAIGRVIKS